MVDLVGALYGRNHDIVESVGNMIDGILSLMWSTKFGDRLADVGWLTVDYRWKHILGQWLVNYIGPEVIVDVGWWF